jgi:NAD(P)-dependent dehydrogenase (short-subunit alcohol dehydrogenase family)
MKAGYMYGADEVAERNGNESGDDGARPETVVVTGATAGVGRATVQRLARDGCSIGLLAREPARLEATRREVEELGGRAVAVPTDVADADQVEEAASRVEDELGPIDVWINNAMVTVLSPFEEMRPSEFRRVTDVTYLGTVNGTLAALRRMRPRDSGTIVQVGSALAYRSIPLQSAYCGAKSAIRGFTDSVRCELVHQKSSVHITMVQLPALNTPQFDWCRTRLPGRPQPVPPIYEPEVAARAVVAASRRHRREIFVGATSVFSILGQRVAPGLMDLYLGRTGYDDQIEPDDVSSYPPLDPAPEENVGRRPDNLFQPVPGDVGAHGRFDGRSRGGSPQLQATLHRKWLAVALGATVGIAALVRAR